MTDTSQLTEFCVYLKVAAGYEGAFLEASLANQAGARREPGNLTFEIYRSTLDPLQFVFVEAYDSVESVTKHRETPYFVKWLETAEPMLAEPRKRVPGQTVPSSYERISPP